MNKNVEEIFTCFLASKIKTILLTFIFILLGAEKCRAANKSPTTELAELNSKGTENTIMNTTKE